MADSRGNIAGLAVELDYSRPNGISNVSGGGRGRFPSSGRGGQQPNYDIDDIMPYPTGLQLDDAGTSALVYKAVGGLRRKLIELRRNGIDPINGPDYNDPVALREFENYHRAQGALMEIIEKARQGREHQKLAMEWNAMGKATIQDRVKQGGGEFLSAETMLENTFPNSHAGVVQANKELSYQPQNEEEAEALKEYHAGMMNMFEQQAANGEISEEAAMYFQSLLAPPKEYDPAMDDAKLDVLKSQAYKNRRQGATAGGTGSAGPGFIEPRMWSFVNWIKNGGEDFNEGWMSNVQLEPDSEQSPFIEAMRKDPNTGEVVITLGWPDPENIDQMVARRVATNFGVSLRSDGKYEMRMTPNQALGLTYGSLDQTRQSNITKLMNEAGLVGQDLSVDGLYRVMSGGPRNSADDPLNLSGPTRTSNSSSSSSGGRHTSLFNSPPAGGTSGNAKDFLYR